MIKEIVKDTFILSQHCSEVTKQDLYVVDDLLDTIKAHAQTCVGMAANMIGITKRMIVILDEREYLIMINPVIIKTSGKHYTTSEGCLCHVGEKEVKRYEKIKVEYFDRNFKKKIKTYIGFKAQIIQHEIDHCDGILI